MDSVSVIMCTFNNGRFIEEAIRSLLRQTQLPEEIIVIDDGSTDGTEEIVRSLHEPRIRYLYQSNRGPSAARNRGILLSTGDYVAFLDADDRWRETMVEKQLAVMHSDPSLVCCFTNFVRFENDTGAVLADAFSYLPLDSLKTCPGPIPNTSIVDDDPFCGLIRFGIIPAFTQVLMCRRSAINGMSFNETLRVCEDTEFVLRLFLKGNVAYNTEVLADIRRHDSNTTKDYSMTAVAELAAFRILEPAVPAGARRRAFADRFVKTHVDAACAYINRGHAKSGVATYFRAFKTEGSYLRKTKGAVRMAMTAWDRLRS